MELLARSDFEASVKEVELLLALAASANHDERPALLKSSVLLLMAKVENYLESAIEEARYEIETSAVLAADLPAELVIASLQYIVDESFISQLKAGSQRALERLRDFAPALTGEAMTSLKIDTRFSYGRHGEAEIKKLFARLGVKDVFAEIKFDDDSLEVEAIKADINSLTAIRNNIIHNDASPSFTVEQVEGFVVKLLAFARGVEGLLTDHCKRLCVAKLA